MGKTIPGSCWFRHVPFDAGAVVHLIAALVMAHGAILVTHIVGELERVAGLIVEDWFD